MWLIHGQAYTDYSDSVARRMGFIPLPLAVLVRRYFHLFNYSGYYWIHLKDSQKILSETFFFTVINCICDAKIWCGFGLRQLIRVVMSSVKIQGALSSVCLLLFYLG